MSRLLLDTSSNKRTCGRCEYKESHIRFPNFYTCKIFGKRLKTKTTKLGFLSVYRSKKCLQAGKDYIELLMRGWS